MKAQTLFKGRIIFTIVVSLSIWTLLVWNYFHGGVPSHHVLARKDLPLISNWWGALTLPVLSWYLTHRIAIRIKESSDQQAIRKAVLAILLSLVYGALISIFFTLGPKELPGYLLQGIFVLTLFFPLYRAEYLLGFVLGMTYTFGGVLPLGIGSVLALICFVLYQGLRLILKGIKWIIGRSSAKN